MHNIYAHSTFRITFSPPYILTQCLTTLDRLTESKLKILKVHLGWLQCLIFRGRGLRPLMRKITCNAF